MDLSDSLLLDGMRQGDNDAFNALFSRYHGRVYAVLHRLLGRADEADDLTQEAFVQLYRRPPVNGRSHNLSAWLCRVALNLGYNKLREERRRGEREERAVDVDRTDTDPARLAVRREEMESVRRTLAELKPDYQAVLVLRYQGMSYAEIAMTIGIGVSSVGTVLARAEKQFKDHYLKLNNQAQEKANEMC